MTKKRHRAFAGFFAGLFLLTSSAVTISVLYTMFTQNNDKADTNTSTTNKEVPVDQQLKGKPLANFTPGAPITELKTEDTIPGTGETIKAGEKIVVDYTGALASTGLVFESSKDTGKPVPLSLSGVIAGWSQGIPGMKVGGTRRLYIPSALGYGSSGAGASIPPNSDLVFDVTVHSIEK